jgi:hypothetical protein
MPDSMRFSYSPDPPRARCDLPGTSGGCFSYSTDATLAGLRPRPGEPSPCFSYLSDMPLPRLRRRLVRQQVRPEAGY